MTASARPDRLPVTLVELATRVLPSGAVRERFKQELVAEMYGMPRTDQRRHAAGILTHAWSLRTAVTHQPDYRKEAVMTKPLRCLIGRHHVEILATEDGERYRHCRRCGKDLAEPFHEEITSMSKGGFIF